MTADIRPHIRAVAERLARSGLIGELNQHLSTKNELRFGHNGSFKVVIAGPHRGTWYDFEHDEGGGVVDMVRIVGNVAEDDVVAWLDREIGLRDDSSSAHAAAAARPPARYPPPWPDDEREPGRGNGAAGASILRNSRTVNTGFADGEEQEDNFSEPPAPHTNGHAGHAPPARHRGEIVATYDYTDETGALLFQVCRLHPKTFRQRRPDPTGAQPWVWKVAGVRQVPYRLPVLRAIAAEAATTQTPWRVYLCEGEKDCDALLERWGLLATTNAGGAGKWKGEEFARYFVGADIVVLPDNDEAGFKHAQQVAAALLPVAASVRIVELPGLPEKGDVSDWLAAAGPDCLQSDFEDLVEETEPLTFADLGLQPPISGPLAFDDLIWNAGTDTAPIPPRQWLLGNLFCRGFVSSLLGDGATGKTAVRIAMALALAADRGDIVDEKVFQRCRVLYLCFEDSRDELRRRARAAMTYHNVSHEDLDGWLYLGVLSGSEMRLATQDRSGKVTQGSLLDKLVKFMTDKGKEFFSVIIFDPFVKTHGVNENDNNAVDQVMDMLTGLAIEHNLAIDTPHHTRKNGGAGGSDPGDADVGRGASAAKNAGRLVYTLTKMSHRDAELLGVSDKDKKSLIRHDSAKVNIAPPSDDTKWFRLVDVEIGNGDALYPHGDHVQTIEIWKAKDFWTGLSTVKLNAVLDALDRGIADEGGQRFYSNHSQAKDRAAWPIVQQIIPEISDAQAKEIIKTWVMNHVLFFEEYDYRGHPQKGLRVNQTKRPT